MHINGYSMYTSCYTYSFLRIMMQYHSPSAEGSSYCCGFYKIQRYVYCNRKECIVLLYMSADNMLCKVSSKFYRELKNKNVLTCTLND